ncbi:hypothetical protein C5Y96_02105 [Blastopirellula marina]|uniref:Formylmethanofuran dehydrogenase subunit B n=1 Tax=Blastopirellula marina TaxID=124 RepID=A0A2S8G2M6_9BACT|nr:MULTISPECIES: hypothetical protein [Pirellulaceae]PQO38698.1 hypothetical protein C5Y96_02105 [Blastopirellula marina]RCS55006.1 hypothetical protein DTL36_02110 [Bremerella cremea]
MTKAETSQLELHHDVPCPGCGCLCDDLTIGLANGQVQSIEPPCAMANAYYRQPGLSADDCRVDGSLATTAQGTQRAAEILQAAKAPLFFGLGETSSEAVRRTIDLADRVGGIVDATHPTFYDPTGRTIQTTGLVTCSLGEIRQRADLVIFWGCDPQTTHLRHWQRYSVEATGRFVPGGRNDRTLVGIGTPNKTTDACDSFIPLKPTQQIAALHHLIGLAQGKPDHRSVLDETQDMANDQLAQLYEQLCRSKYFVFVLGDEFLRREAGRVPLELLAQFVRPMHEQTRGAISILRPGPNWVGAGGVVASRTGYPGGATLTQGIPQFDPDNLSATKLLAQGRVDAAVFWEGPWLANLPESARQTLAKIPTVVLGHRKWAMDFTPSVFFPIKRPGFTDSGTMSRMDDMPLPIRALTQENLPAAEEAVQAMLERISA